MLLSKMLIHTAVLQKDKVSTGTILQTSRTD